MREIISVSKHNRKTKRKKKIEKIVFFKSSFASQTRNCRSSPVSTRLPQTQSWKLTVLEIEVLIFTGQGLNVRLAQKISTTLSRRRVGIFILSTSPQSKVWSRVAFLQPFYPSMTESPPPEKKKKLPPSLYSHFRKETQGLKEEITKGIVGAIHQKRWISGYPPDDGL